MEINGVPLHPLVVHAAVVFTPLAALGALAYVVPRFRSALRWPLLVVTVLALASVFVAVASGEDLLESRGIESPLLETHEERAELLRTVMIGFTLVVAAAVALLPRRSRDGAPSATRSAVLTLPLTLLLVVGAVAVTVLVVLTGDAGAQSVWG